MSFGLCPTRPGPHRLQNQAAFLRAATASSTEPQTPSAEPIALQIERAAGNREQLLLRNGDALIVGSASSCGLHLPDPGVAPIHCWLRRIDGEVQVQDWNSPEGTLLNGVRVHDPVAAPPGSVVQIGEVRIHVPNGATDSPLSINHGELAVPAATAGNPDTGDSTASPLQPETPAVSTEDESTVTASPREHVDIPGDTSMDIPPVETDSAWPAENPLAADDWSLALNDSQDRAADLFDGDLIELLKTEVAHLQQELADRDARQSVQSDAQHMADDPWSDIAPNAERPLADQESEQLTARLDELLAELNESDHRIRSMEELVRMADEAATAEQEERRQIEAWISELEERIQNRDAERDAELDALRERIATISGERDRAEQLLRDPSARDQASAQQAALIAQLRQQAEAARGELETSRQGQAELERRLQEANVEQVEQTIQRRVDEQLREERLQMSEDRAELARLRAELARHQAELEATLPHQQQVPDETTLRMQALREHLRDLHHQEEEQRNERRLSRRLSRLWRRVED